MPFNTREKPLAWRATDKFRKANYAKVKEWRARPESKAKRAVEAQRWRERHPDVVAAIKRRFRERHIERIRLEGAEYARKRRVVDPEGNKRRQDTFRARKLAKQEAAAGRSRPNVCDLCGMFNRQIVFDHCHAKGYFRGWLCDRCNKVLGLMGDDAKLLRALAAYLEQPGKK